MRKKSNGTARAGQPSSRVEINKSGQQTAAAAEHPVRTGIGVTAQSKQGPRSLMKTSGLATREAPIRRPGTALPPVSAKTGEGLEALRRRILQAAGWSSSGEPVFLARERHLRALEQARGHLAAASGERRRWEFFAEELRLAHAMLGTITREFSADDLLGEIFARFCIGK